MVGLSSPCGRWLNGEAAPSLSALATASALGFGRGAQPNRALRPSVLDLRDTTEVTYRSILTGKRVDP
jgi:hypothetical protein